jgi:hypothetical protein
MPQRWDHGRGNTNVSTVISTDYSMVKFQSICLLLFFALIAVEIASAGSKHGFAPIDERDFSYYLQKQDQVNDPYLYLSSTLSLISRRKDAVVFTISKSSPKYIIPLAMMEMYPELEMNIQSEFFDSTIWGQLGKYFNKNIEVIELENLILGILKEFKELNERYKDLIPTTNLVVPQQQRLPTLDKKNYVSINEDAGRGKASNLSMNDLRSELQRYETQLPQEKLKLNQTFQQPKPDVFGQRPYDVASLGTAEPARNFAASSSEGGNIFSRIFTGFKAFMRYLINNKVESCIYLSLLFLLSVFIKGWFQRDSS